ncbi:MAG: hypothetical protein EOM18_07985 [Clostridia bacterium]|nr:hypothetical protein [Clostridia bacterium]
MNKENRQEESYDYINYSKLVSERLANWLKNFRDNGFDINFSILAEQMEAIYHFPTSEQKLRIMFDNTKDREIKLPELVALTQMLQIPLSTLCDFPATPSILLERPWSFIKDEKEKKSGISNAISKYYEGEYYAYYFKAKHFDRVDLEGKTPVSGSVIEEAKIKITTVNGEPQVILTEQSSIRDFYDQKDLDKFVLSGKLYLIENTKIAYSFISDSVARRNMAIMFEYKEFSKDVLYYRTAGMLTVSLNEIHKPLFQKLALFRVPQDLSDKHDQDLLRGILSLNTGPIMVEKEIFEKEKDSPHNERYKLNDLIPKEEKTYYIFSEPSIRDSVQNWTADESVKILLKLREMSTFQAHEIISEPEYFSTFIRNYQQSHKNFKLIKTDPPK